MTNILNELNVEAATSSTSSSDHSLSDEPCSAASDTCCTNDKPMELLDLKTKATSKSCNTTAMDSSNRINSYAGNKNMAEGLMDIALLSANANQLRFLITYNHDASTYFISISLVAVSLIMQITVGIALIFKRRFRRCRSKRYNELILGGVFLITVVNILLAAFTTTSDNK